LDQTQPVNSEHRTIEYEQPEYTPAMAVCIKAWNQLGTTRQIGMAAGPIPWDKAIDWCRYEFLDRAATAVVLSVLNQLDVWRADQEATKK
jgi:hypothetical protein